ncbi:MAG TPA: MFS transporter [Candidatus Dormibacteraeota bacterium]|nr:MFS transporter [Candidatus Dormibacteraeota bacterium]
MNKKIPVAALLAWFVVAVYYFYQYALRSAPSVMLPQLTSAFGVNALGVSAIIGMFYYAYSPFSLVAGTAIDRFGARRIIPIGAAMVGVGALLFGTGNVVAANVGRFLQGAGGVFALVGAVYLVTKNFPASMAASFIGATQMFGMAGGSAGQFLVGPMIKKGLPWGQFWIYAGILGLLICACLVVFLPKEERRSASKGGMASFLVPLGKVFANPQSILCGLVSGLIFIPTTIFGMTWGVRFLQEARGREFDAAVMLAATVPLGWMIGCPLLGFISDRLGRRKPVILGGALVLLGVFAWVLFGEPAILRGHVVGILMGIASGAAMLPYTVIKEANPPELGGSATGVINFINFTFSALLGPVFGSRLAQAANGSDSMLDLKQYQAGFQPLLSGIVIAIILTCFLKETGAAVARRRVTSETTAETPEEASVS